QACSCEVTTLGSLTVEEGFDIVVQNELVNSGSVLIKDSANLIQVNNLAVNTGAIQVERVTRPMNTYSFTYWGAPVSTNLSNITWHLESTPNSGVFDLPTTATTSFAWNSSTDTWAFNAGFMTQGLGYIIKAPNSLLVS